MPRPMNSGSFRAHVDAKEFLEAFIEAFWKCVPDKPLDQIQCWKSLTAFITGKQSKNGGYWEPIEKCVLPQVADKLGPKLSDSFDCCSVFGLRRRESAWFWCNRQRETVRS